MPSPSMSIQSHAESLFPLKSAALKEHLSVWWHFFTRKQKIYIYLIYFLNVAMKPGVYIYIYVIFN